MYNREVKYFFFFFGGIIMENTKILDGRKVRDFLFPKLKQEISELKEKLQLVVIQIGHHEENDLYLKQKRDMAEKLGVILTELCFSESVSTSSILSEIERLNQDTSIHGIMIQSPVPKSFSFFEMVEAIDPKKDVDGLTSFHQQALSHHPILIPGTVRGILELLKFYQLSLEDKRIVILGKSALVGSPLATLLRNKGQVFLCDSKTEDTLEKLKSADFIFIAIGKPYWLKGNMVSNNTVIIDIGTTLVQGKLLGDCHFPSVNRYVKAVTPVPGGIGPMTVISLFLNLLDLYYLQTRK